MILEQGGTMGMPISRVVSGTSFTPVLELPKMKAASVQQRVEIDKFVASLPGNGGPAETKQSDLQRIATDVVRVGHTFNKKLQFVVDQQSNEVIVKVIDKTTDKVIKVLPPEELQRLHKKLKETIGFLFNQRM
jgi:flagellar protein FlaG